MNNESTPPLKETAVQVRLTKDEQGNTWLHIEHGGYFCVPAFIVAMLENNVLPHLPENRTAEAGARFVLHAMVGNQRI